MNRREFLASTLAGLAFASLPAGAPGFEGAPKSGRGVLFDAFVIFDPRPVFSLAEEIFPGHGSQLSASWKSRQFEYMWLRTLMGQYANFAEVSRDALKFAAKSLALELTKESEEQLMSQYFQLKAWPDVVPALDKLKAGRLNLGILSNFSGGMLHANIRHAGLEGYFQHALSTDQVKAFKPDGRAYHMGVEAFQAEKKDLIFAAFAGWDVAGAKAFGYPTFWVNRANAAEEELPGRADAAGTLEDLVRFAVPGGMPLKAKP